MQNITVGCGVRVAGFATPVREVVLTVVSDRADELVLRTSALVLRIKNELGIYCAAGVRCGAIRARPRKRSTDA